MSNTVLEAPPKSIREMMQENPEMFDFSDIPDPNHANTGATPLTVMAGGSPQNDPATRLLRGTGWELVPIKIKQQREIAKVYDRHQNEEGTDAIFNLSVELAQLILRDADGNPPTQDAIEEHFKVEDLNTLFNVAMGNETGEAPPAP